MLQLQTLTDGTLRYDQRVELDGTEYLFTFYFNSRRERWAFSINALDGTDILTGQTVSLFIPLNRRAVRGPPGVLLALPESTEDFEPPGLLDLGDRVKLYYLSQAEVTA